MEFEFYETPAPFTRWLFSEVDIRGNVFEPCVGSGAILDLFPPQCRHLSNDIDARWPATWHEDAANPAVWEAAAKYGLDWTVTNPPFSFAIEILTQALRYSRVGVAMHLRASIHEVLKGRRRRRRGADLPRGLRSTWMAEHQPTGILWLPRFAYQRSKTSGKWSTDSVCACWVIWLKDPAAPQFIRYAPTWVLEQLDAETLSYRNRMDSLMAQRRRTA